MTTYAALRVLERIVRENILPPVEADAAEDAINRLWLLVLEGK
jgi:hypothetical protein